MTDIHAVRQTLESQLKKPASIRELEASIQVHQFADPIDMTQEAVDRELALELLDRESVLARRLRSALERIQKGTYGICLECDEQIPAKRLRAIPWAELCIACQERADQFESHRGPAMVYEAA